MLCIETKTGFALNNEVVRESAPYVLIQFYIREQCDVSTVSSAEGVVWGAPWIPNYYYGNVRDRGDTPPNIIHSNKNKWFCLWFVHTAPDYCVMMLRVHASSVWVRTRDVGHSVLSLCTSLQSTINVATHWSFASKLLSSTKPPSSDICYDTQWTLPRDSTHQKVLYSDDRRSQKSGSLTQVKQNQKKRDLIIGFENQRFSSVA